MAKKEEKRFRHRVRVVKSWPGYDVLVWGILKDWFFTRKDAVAYANKLRGK